MVVRVQSGDFDIGAEVAAIKAGRADIGAIVTFTGAVRGNADGRPDAGSRPDAGGKPGAGGKLIAAMTLEHYPGMTERELERVEAEACKRWPLQASTIIHRYGTLAPGDNIVLVITAAAHRQAAFEAAAYLMDDLKTHAPFWKKEAGVDGGGDWVDASAKDDAALERRHR